jgi:hypothetical protein
MSVFAAVGLPNAVSLPGSRPGRLLVGKIAGFFANPIRKDVERPFAPALIERGRGPWVSFCLHAFWIEKRVEARDGIEPPNKVLQTLPFSFWVPRPVRSSYLLKKKVTDLPGKNDTFFRLR